MPVREYDFAVDARMKADVTTQAVSITLYKGLHYLQSEPEAESGAPARIPYDGVFL